MKACQDRNGNFYTEANLEKNITQATSMIDYLNKQDVSKMSHDDLEVHRWKLLALETRRTELIGLRRHFR